METTAKRSAKKIVVADSATSYREAIDANADILEALGLPLVSSSHAANFTAANGQLLLMTATAIVTLPAAAVDAVVGVFTTAGVTTINRAGTAKISGDFINAATSITLLANQHVILQSDGTNWFIIAGTPKSEQLYVTKSYTKAEAEAGVEASPTRRAHVYLGTGGFGTLEVGGVKLPLTIVASFMVMPGQKWKYTAAVEAATILL